MSIEVTYGEKDATFVTRPEYGKPVTFDVRFRYISVGHRYVVGLKGSDGQGFSHHLEFELACARALSRARRYDKAYSKPRGLMAVAA